MTSNDKTALNKRACELLGICWHENIWHDPQEIEEVIFYDKCYDCGKLLRDCDRPDFTTDSGKVELLRLMKSERRGESWDKFTEYLIRYIWPRDIPSEFLALAIEKLITDTTGLLLKAAVEFMEGRK